MVDRGLVDYQFTVYSLQSDHSCRNVFIEPDHLASNQPGRTQNMANPHRMSLFSSHDVVRMGELKM